MSSVSDRPSPIKPNPTRLPADAPARKRSQRRRAWRAEQDQREREIVEQAEGMTRQQRRAAQRAEAKRQRRQHERAVKCSWCRMEPARIGRRLRDAESRAFLYVLECDPCFHRLGGLEARIYGQVRPDGRAILEHLPPDGTTGAVTDRVLVARSLEELQELVAEMVRASGSTTGLVWDNALAERIVRHGDLPPGVYQMAERFGLPTIEEVSSDGAQ